MGGNHMACAVIFVDFLKMFLYFLVLDLDNILHRVVHLLCICFTFEFRRQIFQIWEIASQVPDFSNCRGEKYLRVVFVYFKFLLFLKMKYSFSLFHPFCLG